jgi:hypothetical protein
MVISTWIRKPLSISCIIFLCAIFLFCYSLIRANTLSLTHDEAMNFNYVNYSTYQQILNSTFSNSHLLNSLSIKLLTSLLGSSELVLRIPALTGHILFLLGSYLLLRQFINQYRLVLCFLVLNTHPFLLDFFSCERGYGLALGLMMMSFVFVVPYMKQLATENTPVNSVKIFILVLLSTILLALSTFAHLTMMIVYLVTLGILLCLGLLHHLNAFFTHKANIQITGFNILAVFLPSFISGLFVWAIYHKVIPEMQATGELTYYEPTRSFIRGSVVSLIERTYYFPTPSLIENNIIIVAIGVFLLLGAFLFFLYLVKFKKSQLRNTLFFFFLLTFCLGAGVIAQHELLNTAYPIGRTCLYFLPIFSLFLILLWECGRTMVNLRWKNGTDLFFSLFFLILSLHFITCFNLGSYYDWRYDSSTKQMMIQLRTLIQDKNLISKEVSLGASWYFEPSINYYKNRFDILPLRPAQRNGFSNLDDFYYLTKEQEKLIKDYRLITIREYQISSTILASRGYTPQPVCLQPIGAKNY